MDNKTNVDEIDAESLKKRKELDGIIEERYKKPATDPNYINRLKFKSKDDLEIFNMLPLSEFEKEQLIYELYPEYKK
jgi:hypothetical protein